MAIQQQAPQQTDDRNTPQEPPLGDSAGDRGPVLPIDGEFPRHSNGNLLCLYGDDPEDTEEQCRQWEEGELQRLQFYGR